MAGDILAQLPQLEAMCERLYNSQVRCPWLPSPADPSLARVSCDRSQVICGPGLGWATRHGGPAAGGRRLLASKAGKTAPWTGGSTAHCQRAAVCLLVQVPQERAQAEQMLRVFGTSTEYVVHCKVRRQRHCQRQQSSRGGTTCWRRQCSPLRPLPSRAGAAAPATE